MMKIKAFIGLLLLVVSFAGFGKDHPDFSIPDSLKENADVVTLFDSLVYTRDSKSDLIEYRKKAITILNQRGDAYATIAQGYDSNSEISSFSCKLYDKHGKLLDKSKKNDASDFSYYSSYSLYSDNRVKVMRAISNSYPYTIVFEYTKKYKGFFMLPSWSPIANYKQAVKRATLELYSPQDLPFVLQGCNVSGLNTSSVTVEGTLHMKWIMEDEGALESERFSKGLSERVPEIYIAPQDFVVEGYHGSNASWTDFGAFCASLFYDKDALTEQTMADLDKIKADAISRKDLVKSVYKYMQSKTRYVSIQLGIGGYQPFPSLITDENGYGDCKALSYYTRAMLAYVGIHSIYTVIGYGDTKILFDDFPANQMNHAILCVPFAQDTVWLECTSQVAPFNYLSSSCTNRKALLIEDGCGKLVSIPSQSKDVVKRSSHILICKDKNKVHCHNDLTYSGCFYDRYSGLHFKSAKELNEYCQKSTPVSDIKLEKCSTQLDKDSVLMHLSKDFVASNIAKIAGDRIFLDLSPFAQLDLYKKQEQKRESRVWVDSESLYIDTIELEIPDGYVVEFLPEAKSMTSDFSNYRFSVLSNDDKVLVQRYWNIFKGEYPATSYEAFIDHLNDIAQMDRCKVVLRKI